MGIIRPRLFGGYTVSKSWLGFETRTSNTRGAALFPAHARQRHCQQSGRACKSFHQPCVYELKRREYEEWQGEAKFGASLGDNAAQVSSCLCGKVRVQVNAD